MQERPKPEHTHTFETKPLYFSHAGEVTDDPVFSLWEILCRREAPEGWARIVADVCRCGAFRKHRSEDRPRFRPLERVEVCDFYGETMTVLEPSGVFGTHDHYTLLVGADGEGLPDLGDKRWPKAPKAPDAHCCDSHKCARCEVSRRYFLNVDPHLQLNVEQIDRITREWQERGILG